MPTDIKKEYLLSAIDAFNRKIIAITADYVILYANRHAIGEGNADIAGETCYRVLYHRDSPCKGCLAPEVIRTGKPALSRTRYEALNSGRSSCLYAYPILAEERADAIIMLDFDLPSMEEIEEKLRRSNAFLHNLIMSSVDAVLAADRTGKILIFNEVAAGISGYTVEEALSSLNISDVYPGDGAREIMRRLRSEDHGGKGKLRQYKVDVRRKNGEIIPIMLNAAIVYEGEREVASIGFFHDLREEIQMQKELEKTQLQLVQAEKMSSLGKLAAGVAHQLNNPLGGITLFTQLVLEEYDLPDGARDDLNRILKDAQRCRDTVKELLEFARQTRQERRPLDINQIVSRTLFLLGNQTLFHNIEIVQDLEKLPMVPGDVQQLNHMFMNIILNAAEAMEGKGTLTVQTSFMEDQGKVLILIKDTGPGIPEDVLPHIFEPFFTTKDQGKGTGLGLSLVYGIVKDHNGLITASAISGEGTTFRIELPLEVQKDGERSE